MTTENPQAVGESNLPEEVNKPIRDKLTIISAFSAVLAALLSAFVSLWVTSIQTDVEALVLENVNFSSKYKLEQEPA